MSGTGQMGAGDWLMLGVSVFLAGYGLLSILFARRIEARIEAREEAGRAAAQAAGEPREGGAGFNPRRMGLDPRTEGVLAVLLGAVGIAHQFRLF